MEEIPTPQEIEISSETRKTGSSAPLPSRIYGFLALGLVFVAGATLTFEYFEGAQTTRAQEQVAAAVVPVYNAYASTSLEARSAIVIDLKTNKVLYSLNPTVQWPLASITKVPLVLAVIDSLSPSVDITIPRDTSSPGSTERLAQGELWRLQDVITFTLVASSNIGAEILAEAANDSVHKHYPQSPVENATLWRMNDLVQHLGLRDMYFLNPSGLDESTTQSGGYGSAQSVAQLFAYAASTSPNIFAGTTRDGILLTSMNGETTTANNTDTALGSIPGLIMGKTGYTDLAGGNLAVVFDIGPAHPVVAVVLGSTESGRFSDMKKLVAATEDAIAKGE